MAAIPLACGLWCALIAVNLAGKRTLRVVRSNDYRTRSPRIFGAPAFLRVPASTIMVDSERLIIAITLVCLLVVGTWLGVTIYRNRPVVHPVAVVPVTPVAPVGPVKHWASSYLELQPGQVGVLDTGNGMTDVATTPTALIGMARAASKNDLTGYRKYFKNNLAFQVADGTRATLLVGGMQVNQVRVAEGSYAGKTGWIAMEWIRPPNTMPQKDRK